MPEEMSEEMIERGSHPHHEEQPFMPEFFGGEKGVRYKREATKRSVMGALGVKKVEEIKPVIQGLESKPLQVIVKSQLATTEEELRIPQGKEILLQRNETLRNLIAEGNLTPEEEKIANKLIDSNARLLKKFEGKPTSEEKLTVAAERMAGAAEVQAKLSRGELALDLSKEKKGQREYLVTILDRIENSARDCHDFSISSIVQRIEASYDRMDHEVAEEIKARLALHDSSELIREASGFIQRKPESPGHTIGTAVAEVKRRGHELTRSMISLFLERGIPGLKIAEAWDLLQDANFKYLEIVREINKTRPEGNKLYEGGFELRDDEIALGKVPSNFYVDSDSVRKAAVREYLISKLGVGEVGRKSLQLAEKLAIASLETSVFNRRALSGNDQLAEIISLREWRKGRRATGRARGPQIHEDAIPGFGKSWLRSLDEEIATDRPLYSKNVSISKIKEGSYSAFCTTIVARYYLLRGLLLDRGPKPKTIDKTFLQEAVVYFNTADPQKLTPEEETRCRTEEEKEALKRSIKCGDLLLRVWWLAGVADMALAKEDLEWDADAFNELKKAAIREELSPEAGSFITENQWRWIEKATDLQVRLLKLIARRIAKGALRGPKSR